MFTLLNYLCMMHAILHWLKLISIYQYNHEIRLIILYNGVIARSSDVNNNYSYPKVKLDSLRGSVMIFLFHLLVNTTLLLEAACPAVL